MKKNNIFGLLFVIIGILLSFTPNYIAPVCKVMDNHPMKCFYMGRAVVSLGVGIIVLGVVFLILKNNYIRIGIVIANIIIGVITVLMPGPIIGTCAMHSMSCTAHTKPTVYLIGGIFILLNFLYIYLNKGEYRE